MDAYETREVHVPERVTKQQRLQSTPPSGLQQRAAERRQLEPEPGRPDQPRPLDQETQQMQLSHILLTIRLALAEVLRRLEPRPGNQAPEPGHTLLHETVAARRYPHPLLPVHLLEQNQAIADKHRLRERLVLDIRRETQGTVFGRWLAPQRLRALRFEQGPHRRPAPRPLRHLQRLPGFSMSTPPRVPVTRPIGGHRFPPLVHRVPQCLARLERRCFRSLDLHALPGPRVPSGPGRTALRSERPEAGKPHRLFLGQRLGDRIEHRVDGTFGRGPAQPHSASQTADDARLFHSGPRRNGRRGLSTEHAPAQ